MLDAAARGALEPAAGSHLAALAARLTAAEAGGPADVGAVGREILAELEIAVCELRRATDDRDSAVVSMRAAVADARVGCVDPLSHVRRYLTPRGWMPRRGETSLIVLAWGPGGPPSRADREHQAGRSAAAVVIPAAASGTELAPGA